MMVNKEETLALGKFDKMLICAQVNELIVRGRVQICHHGDLLFFLGMSLADLWQDESFVIILLRCQSRSNHDNGLLVQHAHDKSTDHFAAGFAAGWFPG